MTVWLTQDTATRLCNACRKMLATTVPTIRQVAELIGQIMVCIFPGVEYGILYYSLLDEKEPPLPLPKGVLRPQLVLVTKPEQTLRGGLANYRHRESGYHTAILLSFYSQMPVGLAGEVSATNSPWVATGQRSRRPFTLTRTLGCMVNTTDFLLSHDGRPYTASIGQYHRCCLYLNRQGGRKRLCNELARTIWDWRIQSQTWVRTTYLPGVLNVAADKQSIGRLCHDNTAWQLNPQVFQMLVPLNGVPPA